MKASAWNKSRAIPPITNFLVLMFSIMAPAMAEQRFGAGRARVSHRARSSQPGQEERRICGCWRRELDPLHLHLSTPPPLRSCLFTSKEEGKKQESHDREGRIHSTGLDQSGLQVHLSAFVSAGLNLVFFIPLFRHI